MSSFLNIQDIKGMHYLLMHNVTQFLWKDAQKVLLHFTPTVSCKHNVNIKIERRDIAARKSSALILKTR